MFYEEKFSHYIFSGKLIWDLFCTIYEKQTNAATQSILLNQREIIEGSPAEFATLEHVKQKYIGKVKKAATRGECSKSKKQKMSIQASTDTASNCSSREAIVISSKDEPSSASIMHHDENVQPSMSQNEDVKCKESAATGKMHVSNTSVESVVPPSTAKNTDLSVTADMSTNISNATNGTNDDGKHLPEVNKDNKSILDVAITKESHCDEKKNMSTASSNMSIASVQLTKVDTTRINEVS